MKTKIIYDLIFIGFNKQLIELDQVSLAMDIENQKYTAESTNATGVTA